MRKKMMALALLVNAVLIAIGAPQSQAVTTGTVLNRQKAVELIIDNSTNVWDASENERFSKREYEVQAARSKAIDTVKTFVFYNPYTKEDVYYYYEPSEQMGMRLMKEFVPEQMKYVWKTRTMSYKLTQNVMANVANEIFLGLYSTYHGQSIAEKSLTLAQKTHDRERVRYQNGLITELDLESSLLNVKEAENAVEKAKRDFENMHYQFNRQAGLPLDYRYELIGTPWMNDQKIKISEADAIEQALSNRMEIWNLKQQIQLMELKMEINRHKNVHLSHPDRRKDYQRSQDDLDQLNIEWQDTKYRIEKEIKQAYQDLQESFLDLELSKLNLAKQKNQLETVTKQVESGMVPVSVTEQLEQAIVQLEFAVNINVISVMNKHDKLERAINVGPDY